MVFTLVHVLSLSMVSLLDALLLMVNTRQGEMVAALSLRVATDHVFPPRGARSPPMRFESTPLFRGERFPPLRHGRVPAVSRERVPLGRYDGVDFTNPSFEQMA